MVKIKKLLYLLQLEEYQTGRFFKWLKENDLNRFEERKSALKWTARIWLTYAITNIVKIIFPTEKAVGLANNLITPIFSLVEELLALSAKIKLAFYPKLVKITVTGSYGKTTFKEMLSWVLEEKYNVLSTSGNVNTRIGVAQIVLKRLKTKHQVLIIEAGAYKTGEIKNICEMVQPQFGVVTVIGYMHLERFGTIGNIRQVKMELADFIKDKDKLFFPKKDNQILDFQKTITEIGNKLGMTEEDIIQRLKSFVQPESRLMEKKIKESLVIIEDNYNANPLGFKKALNLLSSKYQSWQKIVITAGMIELGEKQFEFNEELSEEAAIIADVIVIVGDTNKEALLKGVNKVKEGKKQIVWVSKEEYTDDKISSNIRPPTVILKENDFLPDNYF